VIVEESSEPAYVLMTYAAFRAMTPPKRTLVDCLHDPSAAGPDLEIPRLDDLGLRAVWP
jgi:hypothetical protein